MRPTKWICLVRVHRRRSRLCSAICLRWSHDERPADLPNGAYSAPPHDQLQFGAQKINHFLYARLSERRQAPAIGAADRNATRPERQSFEDVRAPAETA